MRLTTLRHALAAALLACLTTTAARAQGWTTLTLGPALALTVHADGSISGGRTVPVTLKHGEDGPLCSRISGVRLLGLDLQNHDLEFYSQRFANPLCNFSGNEVAPTITPFSDLELKAACTPGLSGVTLVKPVVSVLYPNWGSALTFSVAKQVASARVDAFRASVTCDHGTGLANGGVGAPTAAPTHVTAVAVQVDAPQYRGGCPAQLQATATVSGLASGGPASYRWSVTGQPDRTGTVLMHHANEQVTVVIPVRSTTSGTARLLVTAPNSVSSAAVPFAATCTSTGVVRDN